MHIIFCFVMFLFVSKIGREARTVGGRVGPLVGAFDRSESNYYLSFTQNFVLRVKCVGCLVCHNLYPVDTVVGSTVCVK